MSGEAEARRPSVQTPSIVTLTMNPAVDIATDVEHVEPTHKLRCSPARRDPGGGGVNVARAITRLGGSALAVFPSGGATGFVLEALLRAEGTKFRSVAIQGETREDFSVTEAGTGNQYRFVLPGPELSSLETQHCLDVMADALSPNAIAVASGSLPPDLPATFYARAAQAANARPVQSRR